MLRRLLQELGRQETGSLFDYSIVIVDNDISESSKNAVREFQESSLLKVTYHVEPEQNIALARNCAVRHATAELVAFIDDDEIPVGDWLFRMFNAILRFKADGILGPVKPDFAVKPPEWALRAGLFDRPNSQNYETGLVLHWSQTGTGNVLLKRKILEEVQGPFRQQFGSGGEDIDFFRRAMELGNVFVWCDEALAYETIPSERARISFQLKRALLRGKASLASPAGRPLGILKSISACGLYTMLLPVSLIVGRSVFLKQLVKTCDHLGKLLALCGVNLVREKYLLK